MGVPRKHLYLGYMIAAVLLASAALLAFPHDKTIDHAVRGFSHRVGKGHAIQEILDLFRCFGKGDVILVLIAGLGWAGYRRRAWQILVALVIMSMLIWPVKVGVGRERPRFINNQSFPSGDAATAAVFCVPLLTASPATLPLAVAITGGVMTGRVYDGRHFPSDVLAGAAFGIIAGALARALLRRWRYTPPRAWFLYGGMGLLVLAWLNLPWARVAPYVHDYYYVFAPLGLFLVLSRLIPLWMRQGSRPGQRRSALRPVLLFLLVLASYLLLTTASSLWDRDEPRFSRATVEMVESGNYLFPTFNGQLRPDKPILIYWLMSIPVRLLGPSELSCRMVAPLAALLAAALTVWVTRRIALRFLPSPEASSSAVFAGLLMLLSPLMMVSGTAATTDALLLACITAAIAAFFLSWFEGFRPLHLIFLTLPLAAALLTKGPVGLALPLLVILAVLILQGRGKLAPSRYGGWLLLAAVLAAGLFLAWGLPANRATQGEFLRIGLGKHVVGRSLNAMESHGGRSFIFVFYYIPILIVTFFPWTLYLPRLFTAGARPFRSLLLCWILPILILMSLVATKLPHYILPAWPALAAATALAIHRASKEGVAGNRSWPARTGLVLFLAVGLALGLGLTIAPWFLPLSGIRTEAVATGALILSMVGRVWQDYRTARHGQAAVRLALGMTLLILSAGLFLLPALEPYKLSPMLASTIRDQVPAALPVSTCGYGEPSFNFYLGRGPVTPIEGPDLPAWAASREAGILVATEEKLDAFGSGFDTPRIQTLDIIPGFNYSQGRKVRIHILVKTAAP